MSGVEASGSKFRSPLRGSRHDTVIRYTGSDAIRKHAGVAPLVMSDGNNVWSQERVNQACEGLQVPLKHTKYPIDEYPVDGRSSV